MSWWAAVALLLLCGAALVYLVLMFLFIAIEEAGD